MNWYSIVVLLIGAISAVACETIFRVHHGNYGQVATLTLILAALTNYGVFHVMKMGNSLIEGLVIWTAVTSLLRILSTLFVLHEAPHAGSWIAFVMVIAASFLTKFWR